MTPEEDWTPFLDMKIAERAVDEMIALSIDPSEVLKYFYTAFSSFDLFAAKAAMTETLAFLHNNDTYDSRITEREDFYDVCRRLRHRDRSTLVEIKD